MSINFPENPTLDQEFDASNGIRYVWTGVRWDQVDHTLTIIEAAKGEQGDQGPQGDQGNQGYQGHQGNQGFQGDQGDTGGSGPQGPQGGSLQYFNTTINTGDWTGSGPYTATKVITGLSLGDQPIIDVDMSTVLFSDVDLVIFEFNKIYRAVSNDNEIVFYATATPTENLNILIRI